MRGTGLSLPTLVACLLLAAGAVIGEQHTKGAPAITFYVSAATGSDTSGDGSEGKPFASLQRARDALRQAKQKKNGQLPTGGAEVVCRAGTYTTPGGVSFTAGAVLELGAEDSGTAEAPITYRAYAGEQVRLSGGVQVPVSAFKPYKGQVLMADLHAMGITEFGNLNTGGLGQCDNKKAEVHFNGQPMVLARWPNLLPNGSWQWAQVQTVTSNYSFTYNGSRQDQWAAEATAGTAWVHGFWEFDWADNYVELQAVDPSAKRLTIATKTPFLYGVAKNARYYGVNLLCELDAPNEYYIDRQRGLLYVFPPADINGAEIVVSLAQALVTLSPTAARLRQLGDGGWDSDLAVPPLAQWPGYSKSALHARRLAQRAAEQEQRQAKHGSVLAGGPAFITIEGFVLVYTSSTGVVVNGGTNITLRNLSAVGHAEHAFAVSGTGITISGVTVTKVGCTAINLVSGDIPSLTRGDSLVEDSSATWYNQWLRAYGSGVSWYGVGNTVRNNLVALAPHVGMIGSGNDHVFEGNTFHDLCYEVSDSGAWYSGRTWAKRGHVLRNNAFHFIRNTEKTYLGYPEVNAIYLDDQLSGITIINNLVTDSDTGVLLGGGRRNVIAGNTFQRNVGGVHFDNRGMNWQNASCTPPQGQFFQELNSLHYQQPPWSTHYPMLLNVTTDHPCVPVYNQVTDNTWCCVDNDQAKCKFIDSSQQQTDSWLSTVARNGYKAC